MNQCNYIPRIMKPLIPLYNINLMNYPLVASDHAMRINRGLPNYNLIIRIDILSTKQKRVLTFV